MTDILCIGINPAIDVSSTAEAVQPTHKVRTKNQQFDAGGGAINVARVIATLGGNPTLAYLSGGLTGGVFDTLLDEYAIIKHRFNMRGAVRIAYMVKDETTGLEYRFVPEGPEVCLDEIEPLIEFIQAFNGQYIVASGSLPRGLPANTYAQIASISKKKNTRFVLDTSGEALREGFAIGGIYLAKPSKHEMELLLGHQLDDQGLKNAAADLIANGAVENLVISLGSDGALLANVDGITRQPAIAVKTQSAVGTGDSFVGAMIWALSVGKPIEEAFRYGIAAGAATAMTPGTDLCQKSEIFKLYNKL